jgi:hypothetical protein
MSDAVSDAATTTADDDVPGAALLHPVALGALALWVVNDHLLKGLYGNALTGKLSDFASLVVCPLLVTASIELARPGLGVRAQHRVLLASVVFFAALMVAVKLFVPAATAYRVLLGAAQWPFRSALSWLAGHGAAPFAAVELAMDPSDLISLPAVLVAWTIGKRPGTRPRADPD